MDSNKKQFNNSINDQEIQDLLGAIQPKPSQQFHQRMAKQPWVQSADQFQGDRVQPQRLAATTGFVLLLVLILTLATPALEVVAQRLVQFFLPTISDQTQLQITLEGTSDPRLATSLTVSEAEILAGFFATEPNALPQNYSFRGATYNPDRKAIVLNYIFENQTQTLRILQRPVEEEYQQIGASAVVEIIQIGSLSGEYVTGAWTIPEVESAIELTEFGKTTTLQATWDPNAEIQMLRWVENEMLYEIVFAGGDPKMPGHLTKLDLIAIAESMY